MGFRPEPTIYNLSFEGTALDGLHVRMSCCTLRENDEMLRGAVQDTLTEETLKSNNRIMEIFINHLVSWDLEDFAGQPVPTTREGVDSQERNLIAQVIGGWQIAMARVPNPLQPESNSGGTSEEASLGLGSSSTNRGN